MRRRDLLKAMLALPTLPLASTLMSGRVRAGGVGPTLVVIFQRGGCDGLNTVVPYGDDDYFRLRPNIAVAPPGGSTGALDINGFFGFHPAMEPLWRIYQGGELAVFPAVHYDNPSQSHFDSQRLIETAGGSSVADGWLNRYLTTAATGVAMQGVAFGNQMPIAMRGLTAVNTLPRLGFGLSGIPLDYEVQLRADLHDVYNQPTATGEINRQLIHQSGLAALETLAINGTLNPADYSPENGAVYPRSTLGMDLIQAAQLIKSGLGTQIITIDSTGWDTHVAQGGGEANGTQAQLLGDFAASLAAFHTDIAAFRNQVLVLSMTEFGRTARQNASWGTDHGKAGAWFAMGQVNGGVYGGWPGLADHQLLDGRYLDHSVDYRDLMAEVLIHHLGSSEVGTVLPGHNPRALSFI